MPPPPTKSSTPRLSDCARHVVIPEGIVTTAWPRIVAQCGDMGVTFDSWQHGIGQIALGKRADGKYAATVGGVVLSIPRQVGKTFLVGMIVIALCALFPGMTVLWTAHRTRTATKTFGSLKGMTARKKIAPFMLDPRVGNGEQEIRFKNGSVIMFGAREQGFGRGFEEVDIEVFDEGQILTEKALEDMVAATNQSRHEAGALLFFLGTPPRPTDPGEEFTNRRAKALSGSAKNMVYVEFSADREAALRNLDDQKQWAIANPSFPHHTPVESMERMREHLTNDASFMREALGVWDEDQHRAVISATAWNALVANEARPAPPDGIPPNGFGVDESHDRLIFVAGCWDLDDRKHGELLLENCTNTEMVIDWVAERAGRRIPVLIDSASPAARMIPELKKRGVKVVSGTAPDMGKACGGLYDDVLAGRWSHMGQQGLDAALAGAKKRDIRDAGMWGWDRRDPEVNIAPLVAVTLARFGVVVSKKRSGRGRDCSGRVGVVL